MLLSEDVKNRFFIYCDGLYQINARKGALPYYQHLAELFLLFCTREVLADAGCKAMQKDMLAVEQFEKILEKYIVTV